MTESIPAIITVLRKETRGVSFATIARAMEGFNNMPPEEITALAAENGFEGIPLVVVATHSEGTREWRLLEDSRPVFHPDTTFGGNAGWWVVHVLDVDHLVFGSATSGSSLTAEREGKGINSTWSLRLEVPVREDGNPYRGAYWRAFHEALGIPDETVAESPATKEVEPPAEELLEWEKELYQP